MNSGISKKSELIKNYFKIQGEALFQKGINEGLIEGIKCLTEILGKNFPEFNLPLIPKTEGDLFLYSEDALRKIILKVNDRKNELEAIYKKASQYEQLLKKRIEERINLDPLSGLLRKEAFRSILEKKIEEYNQKGEIELIDNFFKDTQRKKGNFLSLIIADIDYFKRYNDSYGHLQGDEAIKTVGEALKKSTRLIDEVGRWEETKYQAEAGRFGGEEFFVLISCQEEDNLKMVAERIRENVYRTNVPLINNLNFSKDNPYQQIWKKKNEERGPERVSVSLGGSLYRRYENLGEFIQRVDKGMYRAKEEGRNRVVIV